MKLRLSDLRVVAALQPWAEISEHLRRKRTNSLPCLRRYARQIGVEHVGHAFPTAIRLLLPDLEVLAFVCDWFAARVLLLEFIGAADVRQIPGPCDLNLCCLPAAGERRRFKHALPKRSYRFLTCQRRNIRRHHHGVV